MALLESLVIILGVANDAATTLCPETPFIVDTICAKVAFAPPVPAKVTVLVFNKIACVSGTLGVATVPSKTVGIASLILRNAILPVSLVVNVPELLT